MIQCHHCYLPLSIHIQAHADNTVNPIPNAVCMFSFHFPFLTTRWSTQPWKQTTWHKPRKPIINGMKLMCLCVTNVYMISELNRAYFKREDGDQATGFVHLLFHPIIRCFAFIALHVFGSTWTFMHSFVNTRSHKKKLWVRCANQTAAAEPEGNPCWPAWTDKWAYGSWGGAALWVGPSCIRCPCWFLSSADSSCSARTALGFPHMFTLCRSGRWLHLPASEWLFH